MPGLLPTLAFRAQAVLHPRVQVLSCELFTARLPALPAGIRYAGTLM